MDTMTPLGIIIFILALAFSSVIIWMIVVWVRYIKLKQVQLQNEIEYKALRAENKNKTVEYSNQVLEFVRSIVGQVAVLKFRTWEDNHDLSKISEANLKPLVTEVATMVKESINVDNISIGEALFTKEFFEKYIVETSVILIKQMFETAIAKRESEGYDD